MATGLFFEGPDRWTSNPAEAHDFKMIDRALNFVETWSLKDMELAFAFSGDRQVKAVPIEKIALRYSDI